NSFCTAEFMFGDVRDEEKISKIIIYILLLMYHITIEVNGYIMIVGDKILIAGPIASTVDIAMYGFNKLYKNEHHILIIII
ncbi:hypothetical protein ACJX0J_023067, partial [Zea mays]